MVLRQVLLQQVFVQAQRSQVQLAGCLCRCDAPVGRRGGAVGGDPPASSTCPACFPHPKFSTCELRKSVCRCQADTHVPPTYPESRDRDPEPLLPRSPLGTFHHPS